ncbi:DUF962 domain-containing protein [Pseudoalteromonas aurantia]|uniref:DUF962 domain-containing protein n=1 Tax=Pseudoalteromonas aurantia TaxID=43654 RepID=A0A5S3VEX3_9GAMM|nr:DUF962 domain-containing protein [Pseudoalteromonas aurantia]TMO70413.1 DUF962 domain-containing protein [Pseudoalteromonas aurantia]
MTNKIDSFHSFNDFYVFYLTQHNHPKCRALHYLGSSCVILSIVVSLFTQSLWYLLLAPVTGYGFAWLGHLLFEKNHPATFKYPLYSFLADWVMYFQWLTRKNTYSK